LSVIDKYNKKKEENDNKNTSYNLLSEYLSNSEIEDGVISLTGDMLSILDTGNIDFSVLKDAIEKAIKNKFGNELSLVGNGSSSG